MESTKKKKKLSRQLLSIKWHFLFHERTKILEESEHWGWGLQKNTVLPSENYVTMSDVVHHFNAILALHPNRGFCPDKLLLLKTNHILDGEIFPLVLCPVR